MELENVEDVYPLSPMQQGMLFQALYAPESALYFEQYTCVLHGHLSLTAFKQAWQDVIMQHPILRVFFVWEELEEPIQVVCQQVALQWSELDWRDLSETVQQKRFQRFQQDDCAHGFDLTRAPLIRMCLIRLDEVRYHFIWSYHHLLLDGWSVGLVLQAVFSRYRAYQRGEPFSPSLSLSYKEYLLWLQQQNMESAEAFWRKELAGFSAPTPLPYDHPLAQSQTRDARYEEQEIWLTWEAVNKLEATARTSHLTLNTLAQGAWAMLLSRYSGEVDIVFGTVVSGRTATVAHTEEMVGLFINTLPARIHIAPDMPIVSWLQELQVHQIEGRQYEYSPLVQVQRWSKVPRPLPLFESLLVFENYAMGNAAYESEDSDLRVEHMRISERAGSPLTLIIVPGDTWWVRISYDQARFNGGDIKRLLSHYQALLEGMAVNMAQSVKALPMFASGERTQVLNAWNRTQGDVPDPSCFHQLFSAQAALTPHAPAVQQDRHMLTYQQLDTRSNQLAHLLRQQGVGPDTIIALCLPRGLELPLALLAIWKAGAAYLPLDSALPPQRLSFLLQDAAASLLLTHSSLLSSLPASLPTVLCLDQLAFDEQPSWPPVSTVQPLHLAYLIYTSGSTGLPKGTMITHQGLRNLVEAQRHFFSLGSEERILQFASLSFDASVWELALAWGAGACLVFPSASALLAGPALGTLLVQQRISVVTLPPSILASLAGMPLPLLRLVITAGEACAWELVARWSEGRRFCNAYGPTETTVCASAAWCLTPVDRRTEGSSPPIGYPLRNLRCYVLDSNMEPAPLGVCGELYVGGPALARGYWGQPRLTAECFVPDPFSQQAGARLYRTGDLVCRREDGQLAFVGRRDQQIKLHGLRIELGEIAAVLRSHPGIQDVVVRVEGAASGGLQVVSYVIAGAQQDLNGSQVRRFVQQRLPAYMVPARVMMLEAFPLTPNGKIDYRALSLPQEVEGSDNNYIAPRTTIEETLAHIWSGVLNLARVGIHDNFFEMGGDSILCFQVIARASDAGLTLSHRQLFDLPTIAQLAEVINTTSQVRAEQGNVSGTLPLTPIQRWFFAHNFAEPQHWNQSLFLEVHPALTAIMIKTALQALLQHHDALRVFFPHNHTGWQQVIAGPEIEVPFHLEDHFYLSEADQSVVLDEMMMHWQHSLDLDRAPLLRAVLFETGDLQKRLLLIFHHLIIDGVSSRILMEDLQTVCSQVLEGSPIQFPSKTTSYKHWAERLHAYAQSGELLQEHLYWQQVIQGAKAIEAGEITFPAGKNTEQITHTISGTLSVQETEALLRQLPQVYHARTHEILLCALTQVWCDWTGRNEVFIALENHGREPLFHDVDLSRTIGWFTALFPVLLRLSPQQGPVEDVRRVKEQLRQIPNRGIGYGLLRYLVADQTIADAYETAPEPMLNFNYLGRFETYTQEIALLHEIPDSIRYERSAKNKRTHTIEINCLIAEAQLHVHWTYSKAIHAKATIAQLVSKYLQALRILIDHCQAEAVISYSSSDFPEADLSQEELDTFIAGLDTVGE